MMDLDHILHAFEHPNASTDYPTRQKPVKFDPGDFTLSLLRNIKVRKRFADRVRVVPEPRR